MSPREPDPEPPSDHAYFQALEEVFIRLRGAPLLLSPEDWQVASQWHRRGIPLELVVTTLEELFERRRTKGAKKRVSSLRYFAKAVEAAWEEQRELTAPGDRAKAPELHLPRRLEALAEALVSALVSALPGGAVWGERIRALEGGAAEVEEALAALDHEILEEAAQTLSGEQEAQLREEVDRALAPMQARLPEEELERSRELLARRLLRRRLKLPVLSLFAPEAEAGDAQAPDLG